ncbi:MAG: hypothetical protein VBE63_25705 [Lamprobacter sp.]|uniref:5-methylcytosine restriction system specificity protein McrC n=1 Tax=Lamprobacter sp. TaxID=3100796 RepID=UPI002B25FE86|nr:hypothetical protein [Lamprobacter sp.]MEA3643305.1 hypothetical protein [Lamprobacter sp.]
MPARRGAQKPKARGELTRPPPLNARPLFRLVDHGDPIRIEPAAVGAAGDRWIDGFLQANQIQLRRLDLRTDVETRGGVRLLVHPGSHIGAVPLVSPATRRVAAGLLVEPRFRWSALGSVLQATGFAVEPRLGQAALVPGSAREVPPWLLAAPVLNRLEALLRYLRRGFVERTEVRTSPRGRIEWTQWAQRNLANGQWSRLPCSFPDLDDDPQLLSAIRWTLARLEQNLAQQRDSPPARALSARIRLLNHDLGPGPSQRPSPWNQPQTGSAWLTDALQAMGWIAEERGLGGARSLDGLAWDLEADQVWEAWVAAFVRDLAPQLGLTWVGASEVQHRLNWQGSLSSMGALIPDTGLRSAERMIWVDAKYKAHLALLARYGWSGLKDAVRDAHRADLHQALAYSALSSADQIDSVLAYPQLGDEHHFRATIATLTSGRRQVRLILAGLPFGFRSPSQRDLALSTWRKVLGRSEGGG